MKTISTLAAVFAIILLSEIPTHAQNTGPGVSTYGSYINGSIDTVNNQNLNVHLELQIASIKGRGLNFTYSQSNDSQIWTPVTSGTTTSWTPPPAVIGDPPNGFWGWRTLRPNGNITWTLTYLGTCKDSFTGATDHLYRHNNYVYLDPQGVRHTFSSVNWVDASTPICKYPSGTLGGYADDGSQLYLTVNGQNSEIPKVIDPSGVQYTLRSWGTNSTNTAHGGTVSDTNGNYISATNVVVGCTNAYDGWNWTDSAGRFIMAAYNCPTYNNYAVLGGGGYVVNFQTVNIKTNFGCPGVVEYTGTGTLPSSMTLPNNQSYTFTYEPTPGYAGYYTGRLQKITLPNGGYLEYDYTGANDGINCTDGTAMNLTRKVNDGTNTRVWTFSRSGSSTTVTAPQLSYDSAPNQTVYTFDGSGRETSRKIYQGSSSPGTLLRTINTAWNTQNAPASVVTILEDNSTQSEVDMQYDSNRNVTSVSEYDWGTGGHGALLRTTTYGYVTSSNYTSTTSNILNLISDITVKDSTGTAKSRKHINYDEGTLGSCPTGVSQHDDTNYGCSFAYRGNPTSVVSYLDPVTPGNGITKTSTYDVFGNLLTAQLNCCQAKSWSYSSTTGYSLPDSVTSGSSGGPQLTTSFQYSGDQVSKTTNPNGQSTSVTYDSMRRRLVITRPDNTQLTTAFDDTNHKTTMTTPIDSTHSQAQVNAFDALGRTLTTTLQDGSGTTYSIVQYQYDELGRQSGTSNPYTGSSPSYWTTTQLDSLGRPTKTMLPDNQQTTYSYSANTIATTDPAGKQKKLVTDAAGRLTSVYEPDVNNGNSLTQQTTYTYDVMDDLTGVTQGSQTRTYTYDALARLTSTTTPEAGTVCYGTVSGGVCNSSGAYDNYNNLLQRTDARGVLATYSYDTLNRLTGISYNVSGATGVPSTASVTYSYGSTPASYNNGLLIGLSDGSGSESYTYDKLGRPTQLQKVIGTTTYTTSYSYNLANQIASITYPSGRVVQPSYDAVGRLLQVMSGTTNYQTGITYNTAQQMTGFNYGNGVAASIGYSADRMQIASLSYAKSSSTLFGLNYYYKTDSTNCPSAPSGNNGQIQCIKDSVDNGRSAFYTYDALYRLTSATTAGSSGYPAWGLSEAYDRYGNRTAQAIASGCSGIGCPTNSVGVSSSTNHIITGGYAYDSSGNFINDGLNTFVYDAESRVTSASNGGSSGAYVYDANRMRVKKCVPNCTSPTTTTVYVFMGNRVIAEYDNGAAPAAPSREYIYGTSLLAKIEGSNTIYYHQDHLSNRVITDSSGNVAGQSGHFPFGESWYGSGTTKLTFTSYERDSESGNDYALARYYINRLGRFSSPDSFSGSTQNPQSLNRYSYVLNDPINLLDPTGQYCVYYASDFGNPNDVESIDAHSNPAECEATGGQWFDGPSDTVTVMADPLAEDPCASLMSSLCVQIMKLTAFQDVVNLMATYKLTNPLCVKDLKALGITPAEVNQGAVDAEIQDGINSAVPMSSLFANAATETIRTGAPTAKGVQGVTVGQHFVGSDSYAVSELRGNNIYVNPFNFNPQGQTEALAQVAHELIHNVSGLTDGEIEDKLKILKPGTDEANKAFTAKIQTDCF